MFKLHCDDLNTGEKKVFSYDPYAGEFLNEDGTDVIIPVEKKHCPAPKISKDNPIVGKLSPTVTLSIQMGLSCNYSCSYCLQKYVPHNEDLSIKDVQPFLDNLNTWFTGGDDGLGGGVRVEFWGGEPLVYWKTLKPLAEGFKKQFPNSYFFIVTNASLMNMEKARWLLENDFGIAISHDGPGQATRGEDPFDNPVVMESLLWLYEGMKQKNLGHKFAINPTLSRGNESRVEIGKWFH